MTQAERLERLLARHPDADFSLRCMLAASILTKTQMDQLWQFLKALVPEMAK